MEILLFINFEKRVNSTKRPLDSDGIRMEVQLKEDTDLLNPTFVLSNTSDAVNYIKWDGRYYFVNNVMHRTNYVTEFDCTVDALASWRNEIMLQPAHVMYTASPSHYSKELRDPRVAATESVVLDSYPVETSALIDINGCYSLTVASVATTGYNGTTVTYITDAAGMRSISAVLMSQDFMQQLMNQFNNPMDAIISCKWLPIKYEYLVANNCSAASIIIGAHDTGLTGFRLNNPSVVFNGNISVSVPDAFWGAEPYLMGTIYLPFIGVVPMNLESVHPRDTMRYTFVIDAYAGTIGYVQRSGDAYIATFSGTCATEIPLSNTTYNPSGLVAGAITTLGGAALLAAGGAMAPALGTVAGGLGAFAKSNTVSTQISGTTGSRIGAWMGRDIQITLYKKVLPEFPDNDERVSLMGLPCQMTLSVGVMEGYYCQTDGFSVSGPMTLTERNEINSMMNSGVYLD